MIRATPLGLVGELKLAKGRQVVEIRMIQSFGSWDGIVAVAIQGRFNSQSEVTLSNDLDV